MDIRFYLLFQFIFNWIYLTIMYFMTGIPFGYLRYSLFCANGIIVSFIAEGFGLAIGSVFNIIVSNGSLLFFSFDFYYISWPYFAIYIHFMDLRS